MISSCRMRIARLTTAAFTNCGRAPTIVANLRRSVGMLIRRSYAPVNDAVQRAAGSTRQDSHGQLGAGRQLDAARAHPPDDATWIPHDERVVGHFSGDD